MARQTAAATSTVHHHPQHWPNYQLGLHYDAGQQYCQRRSSTLSVKFYCTRHRPITQATAVTVHQCLNGRAPPYLSEHCIPVSSADTRRHLRSANRHLYTCRTAFPAQHLRPSGVLSCWPDGLKLTPGFYPSGIQRAAQTVLGVHLKRTCLRVTSASSALGVLSVDYALYRSTHARTHNMDGVAGTGGTEMPARIQTSSWKKKRGRWLYAEDWVSRVRRTASDSIGYYAAPS